jgi:hypothetical protein
MAQEGRDYLCLDFYTTKLLKLKHTLFLRTKFEINFTGVTQQNCTYPSPLLLERWKTLTTRKEGFVTSRWIFRKQINFITDVFIIEVPNA